MLNYNDYTYINNIFEQLNENHSDINKFIVKIMDIASKITNSKVFRYLNNKLNNYISNINHKNRQLKHFAVNAFIWGILLNPNYNIIDKYINIDYTNTNKENVVLDNGDNKDKNDYYEKKTEKIKSITLNYRRMAKIYLSRDIFKNTPITADMMATSARKTYKKYNIWIPIELALAQGQLESHMGTMGKSSKNNPFNVGENDSGTTIKFTSTQDGIDAYYNLLAKDYLTDNKKLSDLLKDFVNKRNKRYASNPNYETLLKKQIGFIKRYIKDRLQN